MAASPPRTSSSRSTARRTSPVITSGAQSGSVTEIADDASGENVTVHHQLVPSPSPMSTFPTSRRARSPSRQVTNATLANGYTLTAAQQNALLNAFTIDAATHSTVERHRHGRLALRHLRRRPRLPGRRRPADAHLHGAGQRRPRRHRQPERRHHCQRHGRRRRWSPRVRNPDR